MLIVNIDLRACCSRGRFVRAWNGDKCGFAINFIEDVRDMVVPHPLFLRLLGFKMQKHEKDSSDYASSALKKNVN